MIKIPSDIQILLKKINDNLNPESIFLYGSMARTDWVKDSDYEVGILYLPNKKISRSELKKINPINKLRLYPFNYDEFLTNDLDTPFPKVVYMWGLISNSKTLYGKKVVENLKLPDITLVDLLEEATFQLSRAYSAILSERENDLVNVQAGFSKSTLYSARVLLLLENNEFPIEYDQIIKKSLNLHLDEEYKLLIKHAYDVRLGATLDLRMLYKNISFINKVVIKKIKDRLKNGNSIVL